MDTRILGQAAMSAMPQLPTRRVLSAPWLSRAVRHVTHHAIPALASVVLAIAFLHAHMTREAHPQAAGGGNDWFAWNDQGLYLRAAHAWLSGNLDPAQHHYMPGYPLLAVPFMVHVPMLGLPLPDPFLPADLASLIGSLWLVASIARLLAPELRHARALGALAFLAAMLAAPQALDVWIVPWSTSPAAALTLLCLWAALRFHAAPHRARWSFLAGLAGTGLLGFRPTDTSVALVPSGLLIGWALLSQRAILLDWLRAGLAGLAGATLSCVLLAAAYLPVWGAGLSPYLAGSMHTGFEWQLLPLRWVTLMLDPRPLLQDGHGLIWAFPWLVVGLSAAVALITMPNRSGRAAHAAVGGAMLAHVMLYLCYRDLHPSGLWVYWNHHYFKWVVPVASLYCVLWLASVLNARPPRWGLLGLGLLLLAALLPWRAGMHRDGQTEAPHWDATGRLVIPGGLPALRDGVVFPAPNSSAALAPGHVRLSSAKATYEFYNDYKTLGGRRRDHAGATAPLVAATAYRGTHAGPYGGGPDDRALARPPGCHLRPALLADTPQRSLRAGRSAAPRRNGPGHNAWLRRSGAGNTSLRLV